MELPAVDASRRYSIDSVESVQSIDSPTSSAGLTPETQHELRSMNLSQLERTTQILQTRRESLLRFMNEKGDLSSITLFGSCFGINSSLQVEVQHLNTQQHSRDSLLRYIVQTGQGGTDRVKKRIQGQLRKTVTGDSDRRVRLSSIEFPAVPQHHKPQLYETVW